MLSWNKAFHQPLPFDGCKKRKKKNASDSQSCSNPSDSNYHFCRAFGICRRPCYSERYILRKPHYKHGACSIEQAGWHSSLHWSSSVCSLRHQRRPYSFERSLRRRYIRDPSASQDSLFRHRFSLDILSAVSNRDSFDHPSRQKE